MAIAVEMPKLGNTVEECILTSWKKRKGDSVTEGEILAEIETDKASFELPAPAAGTLLEVFFEAGALVPVFTNICVIGTPGEDVEPFRPAAIPTAAAQPAPPAAAAPEAVRAAQPAAPAVAFPAAAPVVAAPAAAVAAAPAAPPQIFLSPRARLFAKEHGLAAPARPGSGPGGRVLEADLIRLFRESPRLSSLARKRLEEGYEVRGSGSGVNHLILSRDLGEPPVRLSKIRETIARRMRESLATTAQYTLDSVADARGLISLRNKIKTARQQGRDIADISINDMVMFAAVRALLLMPELNAEFVEGKLYRRTHIHLGFACDTERGLLVPVVRNAESLSISELAAEVRDLAGRANAGTLTADEMTGATFTVTNLGNLGITSFTPILNPPQVAILGVNTIEPRPVRRKSRIVYVDHIGLSLTCDHQIIDGAPGARFLKVLREQIENIESLVDLKL